MQYSDRHRVAAKMITLGLAMSAKLSEIDATRMRYAVNAVDQAFPDDDPLRAELHEFADAFPTSRRNPALLQEMGDRLFSAVRRSGWPAHSHRADIEG